MQRVIITGATGMIGIHLIQYLLEKDIEIVAIVRNELSSKYKLPVNNKLKIIECDMEKLDNLQLETKKYDVFYHMAWSGTRGKDRNDVDLQIKNIKYTIQALKLAQKLECKRFVGTGSQAEYGRVEGKVSPNIPTNPDTAYGIAKLSAGQLSNILANQIGLEHIWTRILSVYGPHDNENTMIMASIKEMIDFKQSPEYTKAEQLWDYIYIADVARALYLIGEKGKNNSIYCIGSGNSQPLYSYIEEIKNQIDDKIELKLGAKEYSENQVMNLCADISNLTKDTSFVPKIDFKEGIRRTIQWYKEGEKNEEN